MSKLNRELIDHNSEMLRRLMIIVANHLPSTSDSVHGLFQEWVRIRGDIINEHDDVKALKDKPTCE